ncbi:MAG: OmpA family protein [Nitrospirae bacterium]|nr:OmpA family protein [Nitrospirota bacterium]
MKFNAARMIFSTMLLLSFAFIIGCAGMDIETAEKSQYYYVPESLQEANRLLYKARIEGKDKMCKKEFKAAEEAVNHAFDVYDDCKAEEADRIIAAAIDKINALCPYTPPSPPEVAATTEEVTKEVVKKEEIVTPEPVTVKVPKVVERLVLHINFDYDKAVIKASEYSKLDDAIKFIEKYPASTLIIEGHTDSRGTEIYNHALSYKRALAVKDYLVSKGTIDDGRITRVLGYGEWKPVASNNTDAGRAENRRTEILIVSE